MTTIKIIEKNISKKDTDRKKYYVEPEVYLVDKKDACKRLNIGRQKLERYIKEGKLDAIKQGYEVSVISDSIQRFIKENRNKIVE